MNLTDKETKIINMLFDNIFPLDKRKEVLLKTDSNFYIDFALNTFTNEQIYNMFDNAFKLEHKIECVFALYSAYDFTFENIHELIENRDVLIFNHYNSNWRNKGNNRFNRYCLLNL